VWQAALIGMAGLAVFLAALSAALSVRDLL